MNNQEIFDTAALHLIKQGKPAVNKYGDCRYRGDGGSMCAVGVLIPDDKYDKEIEDLSPGDLVRDGYISNTEDDRAAGLLLDLQMAHDEELLDWDGDGSMATNFEKWAASMRTVANIYDLKTDTMDTALKEAGHNV